MRKKKTNSRQRRINHRSVNYNATASSDVGNIQDVDSSIGNKALDVIRDNCCFITTTTIILLTNITLTYMSGQASKIYKEKEYLDSSYKYLPVHFLLFFFAIEIFNNYYRRKSIDTDLWLGRAMADMIDQYRNIKQEEQKIKNKEMKINYLSTACQITLTTSTLIFSCYRDKFYDAIRKHVCVVVDVNCKQNVIFALFTACHVVFIASSMHCDYKGEGLVRRKSILGKLSALLSNTKSKETEESKKDVVNQSRNVLYLEHNDIENKPDKQFLEDLALCECYTLDEASVSDLYDCLSDNRKISLI